MKAPIQWLNAFTHIDMPTEELVRKMIMAGNAVEDVIDLSDGLHGVVAGKVLTCERLEGSDHLSVCTVGIGADRPLQIVCGAPNVCAGAMVAVATDGTVLPGGNKIKAGKLRGTLSEGMLCSGPELGIPESLYPHCGDAGLMLLGEDVQIGADVAQVVGLDDEVLDVEILANRPDCLSVLGMAREVAAVLDIKFDSHPAPRLRTGDLSNHARISVLDAEKCPRYTACVIRNVKIAPSPDWMRRRLHAAGIRAINNIVDITNYVMLEYGCPMHAFDLSRVKDQTIIVRTAKPGEKLTTLDGKTHSLTEDMLVIADAEDATGLAGIMGGEESEIEEDTTAVLFECAAFNRASIRTTARALGIRTDASGRFERGVSPHLTDMALARAAELVRLLECGEVVDGMYDYWCKGDQAQPIQASVSRINARISTALSRGEMLKLLARVGFDAHVDDAGDEDGFVCNLPDWREDITQEADLSEEILRLYGYHNIQSTLPVGRIAVGHKSDDQQLKDALKQNLVGLSFFEVLNFSFISPKWLDALNLCAEDERANPIAIRNPLGEDTSVMRTSLVPSMLNTLASNLHHNNAEARLFEISTAFMKQPGNELSDERLMLCVGLYGGGADFYTLKDAIVCALQPLGIAVDADKGADGYYHPGRKATLTSRGKGGKVLGQMGEIHPGTAEAFGIEGTRVYVAELSLRDIAAVMTEIPPTVPLPKFPAVSRDLALVMDEGIGIGPLMEHIKSAAGKLIEDVRLFDIYRDARLGDGKKSAAFSLSFRAADRTLTEDDVSKSMARILKSCQEQFGAAIRQ